ncbi:LysM peptidoglycan-binding domain-containing protein [uncultured Photobacterium sp.]|uniref:LysM peptidoglycan-binding domain-containing protein n=1 Tax=uncultured Photobacterium sp. TaxID=173973 RepID=UPI002631D1B8|nr:LysM peptidoglycan-binding domain-containing protein [uncultured Photobacterium sp.]
MATKESIFPVGSMAYEADMKARANPRSQSNEQSYPFPPRTSAYWAAPTPGGFGNSYDEALANYNKQQAALTNNAPKTETSQPPMSHTVVAGDSLSQIAKTHGLTFSEIVQLNPKYESREHLINVGDVIVVAPEQTSVQKQVENTSDDEMDKKWLNVPKGQLTFSSEGNDIDTSPYFTRIPHIPHNNGVVIGESGITFGRGLDIGKRTSSDITQLFANVAKHCNPISDNLLKWLQDGAGKTKHTAYEHYKQLNTMVANDELVLTRKQQHFLFLEIYPWYEQETERLVTKADVRAAYDKEHVIIWEKLPVNIKDVLVDLTYRGDNTGSDDPKGSTRAWFIPALVYDIKNGLIGTSSSFYNVMINDHWRERGVDSNRFKKRWEYLL